MSDVKMDRSHPFHPENMVRKLAVKLIEGKTVDVVKNGKEGKVCFRLPGEKIDERVAAAQGGVFLTFDVFHKEYRPGDTPDEVRWMRAGDIGDLRGLLLDYLGLGQKELEMALMSTVEVPSQAELQGRKVNSKPIYPDFSVE